MRLFWIPVFVVVLLLAGVVVVGWLCAEPRADGRTLSEWLSTYTYNGDNSALSNAIGKIGPAAVPFLLAKLRARDPEWKAWLGKAAGGISLPGLGVPASASQHTEAEVGFALLGTQAVSAIPELSKMLLTAHNARDYGLALGRIGPAARPVLLTALTNANWELRRAAVFGLTATTEMALASVTNVGPLLHDPHPEVAMIAAVRSMEFLPGPLAVEAGIETLRDSRPPIQWCGLFWLQRSVRTNRTSALPAITPLLDSPEPKVRQMATNLVEEISSPTEVQRGKKLSHG